MTNYQSRKSIAEAAREQMELWELMERQREAIRRLSARKM